MPAVRLAFVTIVTLAVAAAAGAQPADRQLSALEVAVACAPPPTIEIPTDAPRVVGAQDTIPRFVYEARDLLVLSKGAQAGLQLGQKYYIRRPMFSDPDRKHPHSLLTLGWLSVVAVNDTTAIGSLDHFCDGISPGDYLEPFTAPAVPAIAERDEAGGELDFSMLGRVVSGTQDHRSIAIGSLMLIDVGADQGVRLGARFAVYRDMRTDGMPLISVGDAIVVSTGKAMSLARITRSRDAVVAGDYVVPRK